MLRKVVCAAVILTLCIGVALADEINAIISKVDGNKVTFKETKGKGAEPGPEKTLTAADNVKVVKGTFNMDTKKLDAGEAIDKGLKNEMFSKIDAEKGVRGLIITDAKNEKITEIRVGGGRGKGGKKKDQ